ncbi:nuclear transport factor 2 family protein [Shewanella gaetbuli]|uniref:Nuclear transport factor 2 family protein n=1 Tax=Shewanella gaetbuli TaxID=220752 RepID=A0A9X1ZI35_9GAMM|nr:nuclear transport factor 2 family protein [Shewanella gaetbuli]MCL1141926.1 nuclear transport factor 2 family protein [Shewanella gaetbuli]
MRLISLLLIIFMSFSAHANIGDMPEEQQLAMQYIKAYTDHDFRSLRHFYNRDSVFFDKTANVKYTGTRHIIEFLTRAHEGVLEYRLNIEHMFNNGSIVVIIGSYRLRGPGDQYGKPGRIIDIAVPGVTTLKFDMGTRRIIEHMDLMDYQTMADQLESQ